jgi:PAS domain-containing protein
MSKPPAGDNHDDPRRRRSATASRPSEAADDAAHFVGFGTTSNHHVQASGLYRLLVESVRDYAIFALDPTGRILSWNAGAERI